MVRPTRVAAKRVPPVEEAPAHKPVAKPTRAAKPAPVSAKKQPKQPARKVDEEEDLFPEDLPADTSESEVESDHDNENTDIRDFESPAEDEDEDDDNSEPTDPSQQGSHESVSSEGSDDEDGEEGEDEDEDDLDEEDDDDSSGDDDGLFGVDDDVKHAAEEEQAEGTPFIEGFPAPKPAFACSLVIFARLMSTVSLRAKLMKRSSPRTLQLTTPRSQTNLSS